MKVRFTLTKKARQKRRGGPRSRAMSLFQRHCRFTRLSTKLWEDIHAAVFFSELYTVAAQMSGSGARGLIDGQLVSSLASTLTRSRKEVKLPITLK